MTLGINPLIALGVLASTAATDAAYVPQCGGIEPMTRLGSELERDLVSPFRLRGDQLHRAFALRRVYGSWILARRVQLGDVAASRAVSRRRATIRRNGLRISLMLLHCPRGSLCWDITGK